MIVRRLFKWLSLLTIGACLICMLGLGAGALATRYLYQEPAHVTWRRIALPTFYWHRMKYPSIRFLFDVVEPIFELQDPRGRFKNVPLFEEQLDPLKWTNAMVGPSKNDPSLSSRNPLGVVRVTSTEEMLAAVRAAEPGEIIELQHGSYSFKGRAIPVQRPGTRDAPIVLRGRTFGLVRVELISLEGFHVQAPNWVFENLVIDGRCKFDAGCEHAFHVVGKATDTVIRNNWITNFNAAVKINGAQDVFPDRGRIERNFFSNSGSRNVGIVTPIDLVGASEWIVRKNVITDFGKRASDLVSYGAFFKGGGSNNVFEQNFVRCEWRHRGGIRIGFSLGGGGTDESMCRDKNCRVEQSGGIVRNNIIANCPNDVGIYINKSEAAQITNNALVNTRGIDIRFPQSSARISVNVIDGRILARDGASYEQSGNRQSWLKALTLDRVSESVYADPTRGDFRLKSLDLAVEVDETIGATGDDICGQPRQDPPASIGPIQFGLATKCVPIFRQTEQM